MNPQIRQVTVFNITPLLFEQLRVDHIETLSCPCTNVTIPYLIFVSIDVVFDPVCSSLFVGTQWIEGVYLQYASGLRIDDFRTTANAQVSHFSHDQTDLLPYSSTLKTPYSESFSVQGKCGRVTDHRKEHHSLVWFPLPFPFLFTKIIRCLNNLSDNMSTLTHTD